MENIWQFVCDNWLSNRIFASYEDLLVHCCEAWTRLIEQPWRIISIGLRKWAYGADQRDSVSGLNVGFGVLSPSMSGNVLMP
jgi:hypothetical protein